MFHIPLSNWKYGIHGVSEFRAHKHGIHGVSEFRAHKHGIHGVSEFRTHKHGIHGVSEFRAHHYFNSGYTVHVLSATLRYILNYFLSGCWTCEPGYVNAKRCTENRKSSSGTNPSINFQLLIIYKIRMIFRK